MVDRSLFFWGVLVICLTIQQAVEPGIVGFLIYAFAVFMFLVSYFRTDEE